METNRKIDLRNIVLSMLVDTLDKGEFSHIVVNNVFSDSSLSAHDRAFISRLYLGVLERIIYLDYIINLYSKTNTQKMKPQVVNILRLSVYQLFFMDSVPDFAAINEASKLAKKRGFGSLRPFINGVLRSIQKSITPPGSEEDSELKKANIKKAEEQMPANIRFSVPKWMYEKAVSERGKEAADLFFESSLHTKRGVTVRPNLLKLKAGELEEILRAEGANPKRTQADFESYVISGFGSLTELKSHRSGLMTVQDLSSMEAGFSAADALKENGCGTDPLIVDVCAAPGGKSMCVSERFPDAKVISRDVSKEKTDLIEENLRRMGIRNITPQVWDATVFDESLEEKADLVIADLPCSGLGVIGGKPDIKMRVRQKDVASLAKLQKDILSVVNKYVKAGGVMLYSTCTTSKEENEENVEWLTANYPFEVISMKQNMGRGEDGFFIAVLRKKND